MKRTVLLLSLVGAILSTSTIFATDRHVPSEYATIQAGINAAVNGDRVIIAQGTYTGAGNRELDFGGKAISVQSEDPNNWDVVAATIIDCQYGGRGFHFHSGETASSVLAGLTITKGYTDHGGGVYCEGSSPTIRNCIFSDNIADYGGGMENQNCSPAVANCMFVGNGVFYYGGGMYNSGCTLAVSNCIFAGNSADWGGGIENANCSGAIVNCTFTGNSANMGGGMDNISSGLAVSNCILWGDSAGTGPEIYGSVSVSYSDVQGGATGTGNINADPCFADAVSGDYHLLEGSPCIDGGTNNPSGGLPATDIEGIPRPLDGDADGTAVADMGAYELAFAEPIIALSATYFEFTTVLGGPDPNDQILYVSNVGAGTLNWTISESCGWLSAEPTSGSSLGEPNEVTLSVDISGLAAGSYYCELTISDPCAVNNPRTVDVNLIVNQPIIELSSQDFQFFGPEGGPNPDDQILQIWNGGAGTLNWQISESCGWLSAEPNTGSSTGETNPVTLSVDVSGLAAGNYNCELTVTDSNAANSPQAVDVNLIVAGPLIELSALEFEFYAVEGGASPNDQILTVRNSGGGTLNWQITEGCGWLSAEPTSGISTGEVNEVTLSVDISGLTWGTYNCQLLVSDSNAVNSPQAIDVNLVILGPVIELSAMQFEFMAEPNGPDPNDQVLTIRNSGGGRLDWQIIEDCNWLSVQPDSGSSAGEVNDVNLSVDVSGLASGYYSCEMTISDPNAENSPQTIGVNLTILGDTNGLVCWWRFDEGDGNTAYDFAGDNHGTVYGADWTDGLIGGALEFDGVDDYVVSSSNITISGDAERSVAFWAKTSYLTDYFACQPVVKWGDNTVHGHLNLITFGNIGGHVNFIGNYADVHGEVELFPDVWTHVVVTYDGTTISIYVNGSLDVAEDVALDTSESLMTVGYFVSGWEYFEGTVDDLRIYDRALSEGEIWGVFRRGLADGGHVFMQSWPRSLEFYAWEGGSDPASQTISIRNTGVGELNWQITEDCPWLEVDPNSGSSTGETNEVTVSLDISGLVCGDYSCELIIFDTNALNSPQTVQVTLEVGNDDVLLVPSLEYPTIQAAIDAACHGNTIIVEPGVHTGIGNRDLDFGGKWITVRSIDPEDPCVVASTIIDCNSAGRGFYFHSGEGPNSVLAGLTITNGYIFAWGGRTYGGGVYCNGASPTIKNCVIMNNEVEGAVSNEFDHDWNAGYGGGICCLADSHPTIVGCTVSNNSAVGGRGDCWDPGGGEWWCGYGGNAYGGGLYCGPGCSVAIEDCIFTSNTSRGGDASGEPGGHAFGGGISCIDGSLNLENCSITDNVTLPADYESTAYGGGLYCDGGSLTLSSCTVSGNHAGDGSYNLDYGGGVYAATGAAIIEECTFTQNTGGTGGGVYCHGGAMIEGCTLEDNTAEGTYWSTSGGGRFEPGFGGAIYSDGNGTVVQNCIVSGNSALAGDDVGGGGGIFCNGATTIFNCLFTGNESGSTGVGGGGGINCGNSSCEMANCTIADNWTSDGSGGNGIRVFSSATIIDSIIWNNDIYGASPEITYSDVQGGWPGEGNIDADPCFVSGLFGDYYLSQVAGGQEVNSPCVDVGSDTAANLGMHIYTTRTDGVNDVGIVDMGYHYFVPEPIPADLDGDWDVDFFDYGLFAAGWDVNNSMTIPMGAVVVDGNLGEWSEALEWMKLDKVYFGSPNDVSEAWFALKWDPNTDKIYAAVLVYDTDHVFSDEYISWDASDRLEVYSQGDAEGGSGWVGTYDVAQQYYVAPNSTDGCWAMWALGEAIGGDAGFEYAVTVSGDEIIYEIGVTQFDNYGGFGGGTIVTELDVGDVVGFDVVACTRWSEGFGMLSENLMTGKSGNADQFAKYMLVGEQGGPPCLKLWASDLDGNCVINWADLAVLADNWLWGL